MGLIWDDVLADGQFKNVIVVSRQWDDTIQNFSSLKTRIPRFAFLFENGISALQRYLDHLRKLGTFDRQQRIWPIRECTALKLFHRLQSKCGIRNPSTKWFWRWHDLRSTAAILAREHGADIEDLKKLLGHRNLNSTARYLTRPPEDVQRGLQSIFRKAGTKFRHSDSLRKEASIMGEGDGNSKRIMESRSAQSPSGSVARQMELVRPRNVVIITDGTPEGTRIRVDGRTIRIASLKLILADGQKPVLDYTERKTVSGAPMDFQQLGDCSILGSLEVFRTRQDF